jgi:hypothetical protein
MATLKAHGFEVVRLTLTHVGQITGNGNVNVTQLAIMSDGWVLRNRNRTGWKLYERIPGSKGRGPDYQHKYMPHGTREHAEWVAAMDRAIACADRVSAKFITNPNIIISRKEYV